MRKILLVLLGFAITLNLFAYPVNPEHASVIAKNFYLQAAKNKGLTDITLSLAFTAKSNDISIIKGTTTQATLIFYIFNVNQNDGFVIVSADNDITPILGYSLTGKYSNENLPPAVVKLFEKYKQEIVYVISNNLKADTDIQQKWEKLEAGLSLNTNKDINTVNPLLTTIWNQSPYVNDLCPFDYTYNEHTVTGCPATAMAQIMKYWNYPTQGQGNHSYDGDYGTLSANFGNTTYDWASMPNNVSSSNNAVATLMFHCGVSVDMHYGVGATGGSAGYVISSASPVTNCCEYAYKTYFGYNASTLQGIKRADYSDANWISLLKTELTAGRPIQYAGFGGGSGHTFVCDGFDNSDLFHMNWGWGGYMDGNFNIDALNPGGGGTGSGSGTFNLGQQAVIGIQPPSTSQQTNLTLYSSITVSPNPISFGQTFTVNADIINNSASTFIGDYTAALFNNDGVFIDYIQTFTSNTLNSGYHYTGGIDFTTSGLLATPGNYYIGIYYKDSGGNWVIVNNGSYSNYVPVTIVGPYNDIKLYSDITTSPTTFVNGQSASVNVNILNNSAVTFYGDYQAALYDLNGNFVETISTINESSGLPAGYVYNPPYLTFSSSSISATPGTYILAIFERETNGSWYLAGGDLYNNPININVVGGSLSPDIYEVNNSEGTSYTLPVNFSGSTANANTNGSNIHIGSDYDYYKIILPSGYNYQITARAHDSYNSGNGNTYTCDVSFSYKIGSNSWSDIYDDIMPSSINVNNNGGTVLFNVSPFFVGITGTYLLDINITRTVGIKENNYISNTISLYPNPAQNSTTLDLSNFKQKLSSVRVIDNIGQEVYTLNINDYSNNLYNIPLNNLPDGFYFVSIISENKIYYKKFTIQK